MADDDIDVEGEFDLKNELGDEFYDANELPSKSANLLPEFTSPAWMLEQGWSLDSCIDEKSKATIEKMLLEEQQYMYGKKNSRYLSMKKNVLLVADSGKTPVPSKTPWTEDEKKTFLQGMGIFGRSWSKIANLIPTRTSLQVKNYAQQYMKNLAKKKAEAERAEQEANKCLSEMFQLSPSGPIVHTDFSPLKATIASVTTGQPTVTTTASSSITDSLQSIKVKKTSSGLQNKIKPRKESKQPSKNSPNKKLTLKALVVSGKGKGKGPRKKKKNDIDLGNTNTIIAFSDVSGSAGAKQEANLILNKPRSKGIKSAESNGFLIDGNSAFSACNSNNGTSSRDTKFSDDDIDIDIDIENDDEDSNILLPGRSASPSSVYLQLLRSAQIEVESSNREKNGRNEIDEEIKAEKNSENCVDDKNNGNVSESLTESMNADSVQLKIEDASMQDPNATDELASEQKPTHHDEDSTSDNSVANGNVCDTGRDPESTHKDENAEQEEEESFEKSENIVNGVLSTTGEVFEFEIPLEEKILLPNFISEEEKQVHADFFDGRPPKTPERYLKIRSYIIDCWKKSKPSYLNKTSVRPGLKNCGDVNCIGRVHAYLECIGAINFNCEQAAYRNPNKTLTGGINSRMKGINKELIAALPATKTDFVRPRKRRIRDRSGLWVDEKELEGKTIEHDVEKKKAEVNRKPKTSKLAKPVYDPFKLVPCLPFTEEYQAPYKIEIFNTALSIMDIHSHISKTEVIGMLGGRFCKDSGCLTISMAVPCKSMSTGMQCEMDPVSQTLASEQIEDVGMSVVGWYHSHPTFSPDPSVRDIETQQKFQYWFSKGGSHFVGMIISPYNSTSPSVFSDIRCLTISEAHSKEYLCNIPYKFDYHIVYKDNLREILGPASELAEKYSNYANRVMLSCQYKVSLGITCLSKMLQSVKRLLAPVEEVQSSSNSIDSSDSNHSRSLLSSFQTPSTISLLSRSKIDEVLHWLEQIFLEKFSQSAPLSPTMDSLASTSSFTPSDFDQHSS